MRCIQKQNLTKQPSISVVVPAYNEAALIVACLNALCEQKFQKPYEIILVDNGSQDATVEMAKKFPITILEEPRRGVGFARQAGFMYARGNIIASTDADSIVPSHWLETIYEILKHHTSCVALWGPYCFSDRGKIWNWLAGKIFRRIMWADKKLGKGTNHLPGTNFAIRKEIFVTAGGFNVNLQFGEDIELSKRVKKYGEIIFDPRLMIATHSRRYKPTFGFVKYLLNFFKTARTGKPFRNELPRVKK